MAHKAEPKPNVHEYRIQGPLGRDQDISRVEEVCNEFRAQTRRTKARLGMVILRASVEDESRTMTQGFVILGTVQSFATGTSDPNVDPDVDPDVEKYIEEVARFLADRLGRITTLYRGNQNTYLKYLKD